MAKMKKAGGDAPTTASESDTPKRYTYKVLEGSFDHEEELYEEGDTIELDEGTSRKIIEENPGLKLKLDE